MPTKRQTLKWTIIQITTQTKLETEDCLSFVFIFVEKKTQ